MLGKLLKHEFKATGRIFLPAYIAVIALGVVGFIVTRINTAAVGFPAWITVVAITLFVGVVIATFVLTFVVSIQRFYKNLLGNEGYLMFTLPVKQSDLILAKLIPAAVWEIVSGLVATASAGLIALGAARPQYWQSPAWISFKQGLGEGLRMVSQHYLVSAFEVVIYLILAVFSSILLLYASMAIGQLVNKNRILLSIGAWFGITTVLQIIGSILAVLVQGLSGFISGLSASSVPMIVALLCGAAIVVELILCAAYFFTANAILSKRLNLA